MENGSPKAVALSLVTSVVKHGAQLDPRQAADVVAQVESAVNQLVACTAIGTAIVDLAREVATAGNLTDASDLAPMVSGLAKFAGNDAAALHSTAPAQQPAVPVRSSVTPDYIICLEDGVRKKMLKRHLWTRYGMTGDQYRAKWGLPANYPLVAPSYSKAKSEYAHQTAFGTVRKRLATARQLFQSESRAA